MVAEPSRKTLNAIEGVEAGFIRGCNCNNMENVPATMQEALNLAGNYAIEMSKPTSDPDKSVEESVTKSCCGGKDRQHNNETTSMSRKIIIYQKRSRKILLSHALRGAKVYDKAGDCPVCGMDLVKAPDLVSTKAMYTCPMHPEIIQEGPGSCPICGMV
jgi:Cu2+-exporting ATPase